MSNIYTYCTHFLHNFCIRFTSLIQNGIYPFDMMDEIYSYDMDILLETETEDIQKKITIMQKITEFIPLEKEDYLYIESLPTAEIMQIIRVYNANVEVLSEYLQKL